MKKWVIVFILLSFQSFAQCNFKFITNGGITVTALKQDNTLWTWGYPYMSYWYAAPPIQIGEDDDWQIVRAGASHKLAIKFDGTLWAWGNNSEGQLGIPYNPNNNLSLPTQVGTDADWVYIFAGNNNSGAIKSDGTLWTWGGNDYGQLGNGTWQGNSVPTQVGTDTNWEFVETSQKAVVAIKSDHTMWSWGENAFGALGTGNTIHINTPTQIGNLATWKSVRVSRFHCVGMKTDNTIWAWGRNDFGQLGDGTNVDKYTPIQVGTGNQWMEISLGEQFSLGIMNDGTLWSWGRNDEGQLGIGNQISTNQPIQVENGNDWNELGYYSTSASFGLKADGTCWFWGGNNTGQLLALNQNSQNIAFIAHPIQNECTVVLDNHESTKALFSIYPNPTSQFLYLNSPSADDIKEIFVSNISGQIVKYYDKAGMPIDVADLSRGLYFLNIWTTGGTYHEKFIKE